MHHFETKKFIIKFIFFLVDLAQDLNTFKLILFGEKKCKFQTEVIKEEL